EKIDELLRVSFYQGKTDSNVISLKEGITKLGFGGMNINEIYGNWTETRVRQFQNYYGLRATGVADPQTVKLANQIASSPFQEGETHEDTIELKKLLTWLGYGNMNINQIYGSFTETRVGQFQRDHGLKDHGIADGPTWDKLYEMVDTVFRVGNEHPGVVELKRNLTTLGFGNMNINEVYGNFTKTRVRQFQSNYGLSVTGQVGQETLAKIDDLLKKSLYKGKNDSDVISLKKDLTKLGFGNMNINEIYGGFTTTRMSQFQAYYGLRATGVADPQTVELLNKIVDTSYQYGKSHGSVKSLKEKLKRLGFGGMNINKVYGSYTAKRVSDFQNYYDLKVNGIVDPVTESLINEIYNSPYQSGKSHRDMKRFKEMLNSIGYGYINVNETFGSFSERQIKKFQSDHHLPNSGILDERTIDLLTYEYDNRVTKIFIDPGHGGYQPGASGYGLQEKDLVLDIALSAATQLEKNYKDIEVKLSRSKDVDRALEERTNMANDWKADYFVSFHNNSHNGQASGFESFIYNGKVSSAAMRHQQNIHQYLVNMLDVNNRGAKRADFSVLRKSIMPAILLEFLFIDNKEDNKLLRKKSYREWLGVITAEAIADSFNLKRK
ncbi:Putative peptidoglycan binding domain-containing protein, partial [Gracilibacillus orientalis]